MAWDTLDSGGWQRFFESSTPLPEAFVIPQVQTVSSHRDQPRWAVQLAGRTKALPAMRIALHVRMAPLKEGRHS